MKSDIHKGRLATRLASALISMSRMSKLSLVGRWAGLAVLAVAFVGGRAEAGTLVLGSNYGPSFHFTLSDTAEYLPGGNIQPATLDGVNLPYVYCIAALTDIRVPGTYAASVTTDGYYNGNLINNAGQIAWLLTNLGSSAVTLDEQAGLQAAIWQQVYGNSFVFDETNNAAGVISAFNSDIAALGTNTAPISDLLWITPKNGDGSVAQGLVALNAVPEPGSLTLCGLGGIGIALLGWARRRRTTAR